MQTLRKISATEFRIHNRLFYNNYSPTNYFENYRFEIIIQYLLNWFFVSYGLYLYLQKLKIIANDILLLQLFYYRTYRLRNFIIKLWRNRYGINIFDNDGSFNNKTLVAYLYKKSLNLRFGKSLKPRVKYKVLASRSRKILQIPIASIKFFFNYFFLHFFNRQLTLLYKNLYQFFIVNETLNEEQHYLLYKTKYLRRYNWSFDLVFLINYIITFANTNFLLPFLVYHLTVLFENHREIFQNIINILILLYYLKRFIRGICLLVHGSYIRKDRHGRSLILRHQLGKIGFSQYDSYVVYDIIHCPTRAAIVSLKLWLFYGNKIPWLKRTRVR